MDTVKVKKETKNKIKVDFERAPLKERLKQKFLSMHFLTKVAYVIFRTVLLIGITFIILYPYIKKILSSVMSISDIKDATVVLISKNPTFDQYWYILTQNGYLKAVFTTFMVSFTVALIQTLVCALVAYGLAKFKFKGNGIIFIFVIVTLMVPQEALERSMSDFFKQITLFKETLSPVSPFFAKLQEWFGMFENGYGFTNSLIPLYTLSIFGLGFKNGLFIFMLRQFFKGVPDELEESAFVDGSSALRTFFSIIIPISIPMLVTVFIFAFSWQWTDNFYTSIFMDADNPAFTFMSNIAKTPEAIKEVLNGELDTIQSSYNAIIAGTSTILIALPLIIAYVFLQRKIVEGVERSGIVG